jgi:hypothetical protein
LVFILAGTGGEIAGAMARLKGAENIAVRPLIAKRIEKLNSAPLDQLIGDHEFNFRAVPEDLSHPRLDPYSFWRALLAWPVQKHVGLFRFFHRRRGDFVLEIPTVEDMRTALEALPALLGDHLSINIRWDERAARYVATEPGAPAAEGSSSARS